MFRYLYTDIIKSLARIANSFQKGICILINIKYLIINILPPTPIRFKQYADYQQFKTHPSCNQFVANHELSILHFAIYSQNKNSWRSPKILIPE